MREIFCKMNLPFHSKYPTSSFLVSRVLNILCHTLKWIVSLPITGSFNEPQF